MRPLHIGLLVVGAALAGGLAVKMTQPQPVPAAVAAPVNVPAPPPQEVAPQPAKPTPMPEPPVSAPPPAYAEPAPHKAAIRMNKPKSAPVQAAPVEVAQGKTFPVPAPYEAPPQPEPAAGPAPEPLPPAPVPVPPRRVTLRTGTPVAVRIDESLSSDRNAAGDTFSASLADPLVADGLVIAERGARVSGRVIDSQKAGRFSGTSLIELGLATITTSDGQRIAISTEPWAKRGDASRGENAAKIGGGAAIGAIIGAIAGGGKGAAIGAGAGGGAGAGTVAATRGKPVNVPSETIVRFRLASAVTITERQ